VWRVVVLRTESGVEGNNIWSKRTVFRSNRVPHKCALKMSVIVLKTYSSRELDVEVDSSATCLSAPTSYVMT